MKKFYLLVVLILGLNLLGFSGNDKTNTRTVSVKVTDTHGESIIGAEFKIIETGETIFSDLNGELILNMDLTKTFTIQVNTLGFEPLNIKSNQLGFLTQIKLNQL